MLVEYEATQGGDIDVSHDYRLLNLPAGSRPNQLTVLTAAAKNDLLAARMKALAAQGVRSPDFAPDAVALYEVFSRCAEADEALDQFCLVLDVGASKTEMIIVYNGGLVFARSLSVGGTDFTRALTSELEIDWDRAERLKRKHGELIEEDEIHSRPAAEQPMLRAVAGAAGEFFRAVRASLMFARAQTTLVDLDVGRVYLSGAGARLKGLPEFLHRELGARTTPFNPPDDWHVPHKPGRPGKWMIAAGLAFMALQRPDERLSILPPRARRRRKFWRRDVFAYAACAVFLAAALVAGAAQIHNWAVARDALEQRAELWDKAEERDRELSKLTASCRHKRKYLRLLRSAAVSGLHLVELLEHVRGSRDASVGISKLTFEAGDINREERANARLVGVLAESTRSYQDALNDFVRRLTDVPWFAPANPEQPRLVERADKAADGRYGFALRLPLRFEPEPGKE
jgi:hypothetical protein